MTKSRLRLRVAQGALLIVISGLLFVLVEGLSSLVLAVNQAGQPRRTPGPHYYALAPERRHAQYDEELGWVSIPNLDLPDLYGRGVYLRTEDRGFRNDARVDDRVPDGKLRVICSGDSFTFGQGVANDQTWCHFLSELDERLEAVNMGQRGYGVDQAFLWYMRDGRALEHHLHVFAFIGADFARMKKGRHKGYGKPVLRLERGELEVTNVPTPPARPAGDGLFDRVGVFARSLRTVEIGQKLLGKVRPMVESSTHEVVLEVFATLRRVNREKGSALVLLYLPVAWELDGEDSRWRLWLHSVAGEHDLPLIDLTPEMRRVEREIAEAFFIAGDAGRHYSEIGHAWVAQTLYQRLPQLPEVRAVLESE